MAKLWIREYSATGRKGTVPVAQEPGVDQTVTFSATTQSAAFAGTTSYIAIIADAAFHFVVGASPTATTAAIKIPADTLYHIGVTAGHKIAAIAAA